MLTWSRGDLRNYKMIPENPIQRRCCKAYFLTLKIGVILRYERRIDGEGITPLTKNYTLLGNNPNLNFQGLNSIKDAKKWN